MDVPWVFGPNLAIWVQRQKKMSESQTKAGNQRKIENFKILKFKFEIKKSKWLKVILGTC